MTDETKSTFEFDPLPGDEKSADDPALGGPGGMPKPDSPAAGGQVERPKRGRPAKAGKVERKKRGPRRTAAVTVVNPAAANRDPSYAPGDTISISGGTGDGATATIHVRKKRQPKSDLPPEYAIIRQMLDMSESVRKRVLAALDKVFG